MLRARLYFGNENNLNLLWLLTIEELKRICLTQAIWPFIKKMTDFNEIEFTENLESLRIIRNIIGHNRATTEKTQDLCEVCIKYFWKGIEFFRQEMGLTFDMPEELEEIIPEEYERDIRTGPLKELAKFVPDGGLVGNFQLKETEYFRMITFDNNFDHTPEWVDVYEVLKIFEKFEPNILAITIMIDGIFCTVIWQKSIPIEQQQNIVRTAVDFGRTAWTDTRYKDQNPRFLGDPKIWFYKSTYPIWDMETLKKILSSDDNVIPFPKS